MGSNLIDLGAITLMEVGIIVDVYAWAFGEVLF
jgi:hypothetical protein